VACFQFVGEHSDKIPAPSPLRPSKKWQYIQLQRAKPKIFRKAKVTEFANLQKISKNLYWLWYKKKTPENQRSEKS
jgi:hypothetical protein